MPWERILWQFNVTKHLFIPVVLLKIMWSVGGTFLIEKYKVIYSEHGGLILDTNKSYKWYLEKRR